MSVERWSELENIPVPVKVFGRSFSLPPGTKVFDL